MAKKKMTEKQEIERAENIQTALYAAAEAGKVNKLLVYVPYYRDQDEKKKTRRPELMVLADAMTDRAVDLLLEAFDGHLDGKKLKKPKKAPK
jgi:hydroxypyruvate isomerase